MEQVSRPGPPRAVRWTAPCLNDSMSAAEVVKACALCCHAHLADNLALLAEADALDPETVHQTRVAMRRLRSLLNVFRPLVDTPGSAALRQELKWLLGALGPLRDADVFIADILEAPAVPCRGEALDLLREEVTAHRGAQAALAREALRSRRAAVLPALVERWAHGGDWWTGERIAAVAELRLPAKDYAARLLSRRHRKIRKGPRSLSQLSEAERHAVRISVKKLRYAVDLTLPLYAKRSATRFGRRLSKLQDGLGILNDIHVGSTFLARWSPLGEADSALAWAAGCLTGWHGARVPALLSQADRAWWKLRGSKPFWD